MASNMKDALDALAAISNIINRETETLKSKAIVEDCSQKVVYDYSHKIPRSTEDPVIEAIKADIIENNIMVEVNKRFDQLWSKMLSMHLPVDLTPILTKLEGIEERLKKLETPPVTVSPLATTENSTTVPSKLEVVHVDPDIATKVKSISESLHNAINKIEEKVDHIEATMTTEVKEEVNEEEADEEEAEEEELTEFRYKGKDYYLDAECNVYEADEEGNPVLVGVYNEVTRKITFNN